MATKVRFTEALVRKLKAPTSDGKSQTIYDTGTAGFAIQLSGKTSRRSYIACYGVKFQQRAIGDVSLFSLDEARDRAVEMLRLMRRGIDPSAVEKPQPKAEAVTLRELFDRRLSDDNRPLRPASINCYRALFNLYLKDWMDKPITEITPDAVSDKHKDIFKGVPKTEKRDGRTVADLTIKVLGSLFTFGAGLRGKDRIGGLPAVNPCLGIDFFITPKEQKARVRTSHISDADLPRFWAALDTVNPVHAALIKTLLLTGLRINSARQLTWGMVDLESRVISIPASLMKGRRPLSLPIVRGLFEILTAWKARGIESSGYCFPSSVHRKHVTTLSDALKATGIDVSAHDLRRTFARACKRSGVSKWHAADLLAHAQSTMTDGYAGVGADADDLREPLQRVTSYLLAKCSPALRLVA